MNRLIGKKYPICCIAFFLLLIILYPRYISCKVELNLLKDITLDEEPLDITLSVDGTTAYILCKKSIKIYSLKDDKITDTLTIPHSSKKIAISNNGQTLFLTDPRSKKISMIQIEKVYDIAIGQSPIIGKPDASVNLLAFIDYQCPYCSKVYPLLEKVIQSYPNDVNLVIKHFPLQMHQFARKASKIALAATKYNRYKEMTATLLNNYQNLNNENLQKYVKEIIPEIDAIDAIYNDQVIENIIKEDVNLGTSIQIKGVPALFINGREVKNRSFDAISSMIENELSVTKTEQLIN